MVVMGNCVRDVFCIYCFGCWWMVVRLLMLAGQSERSSHWLSSLVLRLNTRCQLIEDNEAALAGMVLSMRSRLSSLLAPPAAN